MVGGLHKISEFLVEMLVEYDLKHTRFVVFIVRLLVVIVLQNPNN